MATDLSSLGYSQTPSNYFQLPGGRKVSTAPFDANAPTQAPGGRSTGSANQQMSWMQNLSQNTGIADPFGNNFDWIGAGQRNAIPDAAEWLGGVSPDSPFFQGAPENRGATWTEQGRNYGPQRVGMSSEAQANQNALYGPGGAMGINPTVQSLKDYGARLPGGHVGVIQDFLNSPGARNFDGEMTPDNAPSYVVNALSVMAPGDVPESLQGLYQQVRRV